MVDVTYKKSYPHYDPFVLVQQATQVYYAPYPTKKGDMHDWWAVCKVPPCHAVDAPVVESAYQDDVGTGKATTITNELELEQALTHENGEVEVVDLESEEEEESKEDDIAIDDEEEEEDREESYEEEDDEDDKEVEEVEESHDDDDAGSKEGEDDVEDSERDM